MHVTIPIKKNRDNDMPIGIFVIDKRHWDVKYAWKNHFYKNQTIYDYNDITKEWINGIIKGDVRNAYKIEVDGKTYILKGKDYEDKDVKISFYKSLKNKQVENYVVDKIHQQTCARIRIYPTVTKKEKKKTPDLLIGVNYNKYEIKTPDKNESEYNKNPLIRLAKEGKYQADNFIFNINTNKISKEQTYKWADEVYKDSDTWRVNRVVLLIDGVIDKVYIRKR